MGGGGRGEMCFSAGKKKWWRASKLSRENWAQAQLTYWERGHYKPATRAGFAAACCSVKTAERDLCRPQESCCRNSRKIRSEQALAVTCFLSFSCIAMMLGAKYWGFYQWQSGTISHCMSVIGKKHLHPWVSSAQQPPSQKLPLATSWVYF